MIHANDITEEALVVALTDAVLYGDVAWVAGEVYTLKPFTAEEIRELHGHSNIQFTIGITTEANVGLTETHSGFAGLAKVGWNNCYQECFAFVDRELTEEEKFYVKMSGELP